MSYTIQQVANMTGIPATTLRYYDKEGLLPFLERRSSGYREFSDIDLASLQIVQCLKATGMSVAEMKQFSDWVRVATQRSRSGSICSCAERRPSSAK